MKQYYSQNRGVMTMKLYLNDGERRTLLEILKASEVNAIQGKDSELASAFGILYKQISPLNATYVKLKRHEAETLVDFCDSVKMSLEKALVFIETESDKPEEEKSEQKIEVNKYLDEVSAIITQLQSKIEANP